MNDPREVVLVRPENVPWEIVSWIQIKQYEVDRRMELDGPGPLRSLPLLGSVLRFAIEVVYDDGTWDRTHLLDDPVEARRMASVLSLNHSLPVRVMP